MWYNYDGLGKRRNKLFADPDDLHWYRWAGWSVLSEYDTTGASGWEVPAAAARVDVAGLAERGAGAAYAYRLHDHLGSVRGLRGASKAPLARHAYAPYGELNHGAGRPLRRGFTGHRWDAESGMYYAPFRYYMPGAGRWLSRDPLGFVDGPNVYGYVSGQPTQLVDPLGLAWWDRFTWSNPFKKMKWSWKGLGRTIGCLMGLDTTVHDVTNRTPNLPPSLSNPMAGPAIAMLIAPEPARRYTVMALRPVWQPVAARFTTRFGMRFAGRFLIGAIPVVGAAALLGITAYEAGKCSQKHMK